MSLKFSTFFWYCSLCFFSGPCCRVKTIHRSLTLILRNRLPWTRPVGPPSQRASIWCFRWVEFLTLLYLRTTVSNDVLAKLPLSSVWDPDPPVFGPPGYGSISQRYGSGSGSFPFLINVFSGPVLRIRDVYPGSRIRLFSIPDPHQRIYVF